MLGGVIFPNRPKWKSETGTDDDTVEDPKKSIGQTGQLIQATLATISNLRSSNMAIENPPSVDDMSTKNLHLQKMFNLPR